MSSITVSPSTIEELREVLLRGGATWIIGSDSKAAFRNLSRPSDATEISLSNLSGIIQHDVDDQVVVVRAGTSVRELQQALVPHGQCLPVPSVHNPDVPAVIDGVLGTVGGMCAMNMPHALAGQCGGPREWVLGMTVMRPDGTLAKSGSKAVKSVAGFDVHKLMTGARGTLGVIVEVILRTFPVKALRTGEWTIYRPELDVPLWIQRTLRSDFKEAVRNADGQLIAADAASSTLWATGQLRRFPHDWVLRSGSGEANCIIEDPTLRTLMVRAKSIYDPENRLNPGEFGFL